MTPGDLYEKCVALGLCERAKINKDATLHFAVGKWERRMTFPCFTQRPMYEESEVAEDLACMTVLRALLKHAGQYRAVGLTESPVIGGSSDYVAEITGPDEWVDVSECDKTPLSALCLCLLRARGVDATPSPTPRE